jgi:hypothetical protein
VEGSAQPVVTLRDWHKAQAIVERQRYSLHHAYDVLTGKASKWLEETLGEEVYNFIAAHGPIRLREIQRHFQKRPEFKSTERARREMEAICKEYNIASRTVIRGGIVYAIREEELASFAVAAKGTKG